jgi:hypothetical protein
MSNYDSNPTFAFEFMIDSYLKVLNDDKRNLNLIPELEVRFGTKPKNYSREFQDTVKPITKIDFDNVIKQLYSSGFKSNNLNGQYLLRITPEMNHINKKNETKKSNTRLEIVGIDLIQAYCEHSEDLQEILKLPQIVNSSSPDNLIKFTMKSEAKLKDTDKHFMPVDFQELGFRVSFQYEKNSSTSEASNDKLLTTWNTLKKTYRYLNRTKFEHPDYPFIADISIIRSSKRGKDSKHIPENTLKNAGVFNNEETYEIELEIDNKKAGEFSKEHLLIMLRKTIRIILSGLQQSNYPIGYTEKATVINSYMMLIHGKDFKRTKQIETRDFIGPNSMTLQLNNIIPITTETYITNIRTNYSVTDKADGKRTLLYISDNGRLYLIDTNMNVMFTGSITNLASNEMKQKFHNSLLDGEFIKYNKYGKMVNLFAAFDIYYGNKTYIGNYPFEIDPATIELGKEIKSRYNILKIFTADLKFKSVVENSSNNQCNFSIKCKDFAFTFTKNSIFDACKEVLAKVHDEYEKDGLIFTPADSGVGGTKIDSLKNKITWKESFKWKPPQFNTIDFLVKIKKNVKGQNEIHSICSDSTNLQDAGKSIKWYQTLELMCGYSKQKDSFLNPMLELVTDESPLQNDNVWEYQPVKFYPTNPEDQNACYCNIMLTDNVMKTEGENGQDGEYFEGDMIVEFRYDLNKVGPTDDNAWKWIPIRVRYDKTAELMSSLKDKLNGKKTKPNFGNSYEVANSNWTSIHNPITEKMLISGENIPTNVTDNSVYYNKTNRSTVTRGLRDFHNLYVKRQLILCASKPRGTLIDYAVGKGGDLNKWISANLSFVFGIDVKSDNINNQKDGACARYLKEKIINVKNKGFPKVLFAVGNSELNIRDNSAFGNSPGSLDEQISNSVFGVGEKDPKSALKAVIDQFGVASNGFDLSSVQFALHYFFKNKNTVHQFMRNVSECTKQGGYFIATCYDGKTIFEKLKRSGAKNMENMEDDSTKESILILTKDKQKKMLEITQLYHETTFDENEPCLGYAIDVWQESINKSFVEYLVNYKYVVKLMLNYGFDLLLPNEVATIGLANSSGLFSELYDKMVANVKNKLNFQTAINMTSEEKEISFMNRYFVFKKNRTIENTNLVQRTMNEIEEDDNSDTDNNNGLKSIKKKKIIVKHLNDSNVEKKKDKDDEDKKDEPRPKIVMVKRKTILKKMI